MDVGTDAEVAVASVARTPILGCNGGLAGWHPVALAAEVAEAVLTRAGVDACDLDEVVVGCADPVGANGANVARAVVLSAGWPHRVSGYVVDRGATSGITAVQVAAASIQAAAAEKVLVIGLGLSSVVPPGAASTSRVYGSPWQGVLRQVTSCGGLLPAPRLAEHKAAEAGFDSAELHAMAERSRQRRLASDANAAVFAIPARPKTTGRKTSSRHSARIHAKNSLLTVDEIREWDEDRCLKPIFTKDGLLTAATFAPPADAIAAMLLTRRSSTESSSTAKTIPVLAIMASSGRAAGSPFDPTGGAAQAVQQALSEAGISLDDVQETRIVETDAATLLLVARSLQITAEQVNTSGGALATGNAGAAEEIRMIADCLLNTHDGTHTSDVPSRSQDKTTSRAANRSVAEPASTSTEHSTNTPSTKPVSESAATAAMRKYMLTISVGLTGSTAVVWQQ